MRILVAQINPTIGDLVGNARLIREALDQGRTEKVDLVLFPELALTGYPPEDFLLLPQFLGDAARLFESLIPETKGLAAIIGIPRYSGEGEEKPLRNSAAILENGQLLGFEDKTLLPTYDVFDERRYFSPKKEEARLWTIAGRQVAITICEDIWQHGELLRNSVYTRDPILELAQLQPDLLLNLSASPFSLNKEQDRLATVQAAARSLHCPVILCNQVGGNDSLIFDGGSVCVDARGYVQTKAKKFTADYLIVESESAAKNAPCLSNPLEDLYQALVLGIRDYFHKSGFTKACLGLSGGIDSAVMACLAVEALGAEHVLGVMLPSRFSSPGSLSDAEELARNLRIQIRLLPIEESFEALLSTLAPSFAGKPWDITEENLQSRIRGTLLMALSNKEGYIVLSTGNKSEMAMGYTTLYGDLCGGLAALSDVTKQQVYALARWINREKPLIPQNSIDKPPSAELRPNQKDSDSLPDYAIIDAVLQDYLESHLPPAAIAEKHGYPLSLVNDLIRRIHLNEYKRRQAPPGLRISEKAFSTGRRFPIVQGYVKSRS